MLSLGAVAWWANASTGIRVSWKHTCLYMGAFEGAHVSPQPEQNPLDHSRALSHPAIVTFTHYLAVMDSVWLNVRGEWDKGSLDACVCVCVCVRQQPMIFMSIFSATCSSIMAATSWRGKIKKLIDSLSVKAHDWEGRQWWSMSKSTVGTHHTQASM